jgi:hypothetical protein
MRTRTLFLLLSAVSTVSLLAQTPTITGVTNALSFTPQLSPGVLATVFGTNLSGNSLQVTLHGLSCPVTYTSAGQLNIQVPWEAAVGPSQVTVTHDGLSSTPFSITLTTYSPALVSIDGSGYFMSGSYLISTTNPANAGDVLSTAAIGLGDTTPASVTGVVTPNAGHRSDQFRFGSKYTRWHGNGKLESRKLIHQPGHHPDRVPGRNHIGVRISGPSEPSVGRYIHPDGHDSEHLGQQDKCESQPDTDWAYLYGAPR